MSCVGYLIRGHLTVREVVWELDRDSCPKLVRVLEQGKPVLKCDGLAGRPECSYDVCPKVSHSEKEVRTRNFI